MTTWAPIPGVTVVGLGYRARHGKDTAARHWIETYPYLVERFSFADALRAICRLQFGMTTKDGALLQKVGSGMRQSVDEEVWLRPVYWSIHERRPRIAVITDVRYPNEAAMVKAMGGYLVQVSRTNADGSPFQVNDGRDPNHETERALAGYEGWDWHISASTLEQLHAQAMAVLQEVRRAT